MIAKSRSGRFKRLFIDFFAFAVYLSAGVVVFLPFAFGTSPLDAVTLRVPGNQGNWWHALVGAPFFLAFPMVWLRLRSITSGQPLTLSRYRMISIAAILSICGTIAVETPFLLHLAGTSDWQRVAILSLGFGIILASGATLFWRRGHITPDRICAICLITAYLANAALCLVVYSNAAGPVTSRAGWLITAVIVWPMSLELIWTYIDSFRRGAQQSLAEH
jgi:hypothetical protein